MRAYCLVMGSIVRATYAHVATASHFISRAMEYDTSSLTLYNLICTIRTIFVASEEFF